MQAYDIENSIAEGREGIESLLAFVLAKADEMEAHEMEKAVFQRLLSLGLAALKVYFAQKGTGDVGEAVRREDGAILPRAGLRAVQYLSLFGCLPVPRTCYRTPGEPGVYPLDAQVNLPERCYSYYLQEWMNLLSQDHPFAEGAERLSRLFGLSLVESAMAAVARDGAEDYDAYYEQKAAPEPEEEGEILAVSFDGKGVPMIKAEAARIQAKLGKGEKRQKKKEALVGVSYSVDRKERSAAEVALRLVNPQAERDERSATPQQEEPKGSRIRRMASVAREKAEVMQALKGEVERRDPERRKPLAVLLDGALGLWNLALRLFGEWKNATYILDIIHVRDYLWDAANALHEEGGAEGRRWVQERLEQILKGGVGYTVGGLRQTITKRGLKGRRREALEKAITYFESHKRWMRYDVYLAAGMPIATGVVESACSSVVKKRMEGEGKRWSVEGAESILLLRSLEKSDDSSAYWPFHVAQAKQRLYETHPRYSPLPTCKLAA